MLQSKCIRFFVHCWTSSSSVHQVVCNLLPNVHNPVPGKLTARFILRSNAVVMMYCSERGPVVAKTISFISKYNTRRYDGMQNLTSPIRSSRMNESPVPPATVPHWPFSTASAAVREKFRNAAQHLSVQPGNSPGQTSSNASASVSVVCCKVFCSAETVSSCSAVCCEVHHLARTLSNYNQISLDSSKG